MVTLSYSILSSDTFLSAPLSMPRDLLNSLQLWRMGIVAIHDGAREGLCAFLLTNTIARRLESVFPKISEVPSIQISDALYIWRDSKYFSFFSTSLTRWKTNVWKSVSLIFRLFHEHRLFWTAKYPLVATNANYGQRSRGKCYWIGLSISSHSNKRLDRNCNHQMMYYAIIKRYVSSYSF